MSLLPGYRVVEFLKTTIMSRKAVLMKWLSYKAIMKKTQEYWYKLNPAGTWRKYNVASTLRRRYIYVMCPLGSDFKSFVPIPTQWLDTDVAVLCTTHFEKQNKIKWPFKTLRACAKSTDIDSSRACSKSHPGICSPLIH